MDYLKKVLLDVFDLNADRASMEEISERIESGALLKGTNMAILILAMFIASIGLNMNSTAVIIGAMLISPLMGVIMAIGYGIATYDTAYVRKSFLKLLFQVGFCILTSTIYFYISPISTASSELLARTEPTIWDVLIALFGGLAGIIGITRKEKSNVIPGVAIATALMPPLCTAGYGIATHSLKFFSGALYLFCINGVFICLSTFIVLKFIKVPAKQYVSIQVLRRQKFYLAIIGIITIIPSVYTAYQSVRDNVEKAQATSYINEYFNYDDRQVVAYHIREDSKTFEVVLIGKTLEETQIDKLKKDLLNYSQLKDLNLKIIQNIYDEGYSKQDIEKLINSSIQQRDGVLNVANKDSDLMKYQNLSVQYYPAYQRITDNQAILKAFNTKGKILFPQIDKIEGGTINNINEKGEINVLKFMVIVYVKEQLSSQDVIKLKSWMESEANMPVILNVQISSDNEDNIISGNGISW